MSKTFKAFAVVGDGYVDTREQLAVASTDGSQLAIFASAPAAFGAVRCSGEEVLNVTILGTSEHESLVARYEHLQQRLTAADERADVLEGLLRLARGAIGENQWTLLTKDIDSILPPETKRTNTSGNAHCPHDGICHTSDETCSEAQARIVSLTAPAGAGQ